MVRTRKGYMYAWTQRIPACRLEVSVNARALRAHKARLACLPTWIKNRKLCGYYSGKIEETNKICAFGGLIYATSRLFRLALRTA